MLRLLNSVTKFFGSKEPIQFGDYGDLVRAYYVGDIKKGSCIFTASGVYKILRTDFGIPGKEFVFYDVRKERVAIIDGKLINFWVKVSPKSDFPPHRMLCSAC